MERNAVSILTASSCARSQRMRGSVHTLFLTNEEKCVDNPLP
jgi:hypothetical protein